MSYASLKAERDSWVTQAYLRTNGITITNRDLGGLAKMGFTSLEQGQTFATARDRNPAVKNFLDSFAAEAVPMRNGQPVASRLDPVMAAMGQRFRQDPRLLDKLAEDFRENPGVDRQLAAAIRANPARAAQAIRAYTGADGTGPNGARNGQLEQLIRQINPPPAPAAAPQRREAPPPAARVREREPDPIRSTRTEAPSRPEPAAVVAATGNDDGANDTGPSGPASTTVTAAQVGSMAEPLVGTLRRAFPDMVGLDEFENKLKTDTAFQARVAANFSNNPEFVTELMKFAQPGTGEGENNGLQLLQQFGRRDIQNLVDNPEQLTQDSYVDGLTSKLKMASGPMGNIGGMLQNLFGGNFDLGNIGQGIMSFLQPLLDMFGDLFRGFGANGGNVMSMTNGSGNMLSNLMGNLGSAMHLGAAMRSNDPYLLAQAKVVDRNNDGNITDADKYEVTDASGNKHNVYETRGLTDGHNGQGQILRAYVSEIDPANGQPKAMKTITVTADGNVTTIDANAPPAAQTPPPTPAPANQELANRNNTTPSPGGVDMAPNSGLGGIY